MKPQKFKYPGDAAFQRLLQKYECPTPFHVVRMRFLGEIASLDFGASPIKTIESLWDGDLPVFDGDKEASTFFQAMMSMWNRMARHQDGVLVKLLKPKKLREWDDIAAALRMRANEIRDGFLMGFLGNDEEQPLPKSLEDVIYPLSKMADQFDEDAKRVLGPQRDKDSLSLEDYRRLIEVRTREVETLLTAIMKMAKEHRRLGIEAMDEIDEETPVH